MQSTLYPRRIGRYQIEGLAGKGGMAYVYRAWDPKHRRVVAIKILNPGLRQEADATRRFRRAARALYQLRHEYISRVYSAGDEDGIPYLVMEYIDGAPLNRYLSGNRPLAPRLVAQIMSQIGQALDYAHRQGVIHRDIKPSNILLTHDGRRAVLSDFGVALVLGHSRLTLPGVVLGTPRYMAPEQVRGGDIGGWTDIYALGVTCYELLTGQPAFTGKTVEIAAKIVNGQYRLPSQINSMLPLTVDNVIRQALQTDPRYRYRSAAQFSHALRGSLGVGNISPTPSPRREMRTPTGQDKASTTLLIIIICIVIIVLVIMFLMLLAKGGQ